MRRLLPLLIVMPLLTAASAPAGEAAEPADAALQRARAEAAAAEASAQRLEREADAARDAAARLRARQAAAAEALAAAEAQISAVEAEQRLLGERLAEARRRLAERQRPAASLLAGAALMARRPPLLALAGGDSDDFVRVRLLLDSTLPVIRARTAALAGEVERIARLEQSAAAAAQAMARGRDDLAQRRRNFAALEAQVLAAAAESSGAALGAGDVALASGERAERLAGEAAARREAAKVARELARLGPAPSPPHRDRTAAPAPPFAYRLPASARVTDGMGEISPSGVRSRGITLATPRGVAVSVPADGVVRFAGPFRDHDGVVIIEHRGGWMSLIVNVAPRAAVGARVRSGDPLGRALGPLGVELSHRGQHWSPALIAGSSQSLSKNPKGG